MVSVDIALIAIGLVLTSIGIAFSLSSFMTEERTEKIHDNERIDFCPKRDNAERLELITPLRHKCKIHVELKPTRGPFDFQVEDFVGYCVLGEGVEWRIKPYHVAKGLPSKAPVSFTLGLEAGNYSFVFLAEGNITAQTTLTSTATYVVRPFEKFLDAGLHLFGVGMPVLITGLVLLFG